MRLPNNSSFSITGSPDVCRAVLKGIRTSKPEGADYAARIRRTSKVYHMRAGVPNIEKTHHIVIGTGTEAERIRNSKFDRYANPLANLFAAKPPVPKKDGRFRSIRAFFGL